MKSDNTYDKSAIIKGKGAQFNPDNRFEKSSYDFDDSNFYDPEEHNAVFRSQKVKYIKVFPKTIVNEVKSPDVGMSYSLNPYQGCEHGCVYCYARNVHEYWGYSAGRDFESTILIKEEAPELLEKFLRKKSWQGQPIVLSGNTDCYQPAERKFGISRKLLKVFLKYRHPVSIISKNALILRDLDILTELAKDKLIRVNMSITTMDERLRQLMEPRTVTSKGRLKVIRKLSDAGVAVSVMTAPIIPGLNDHEVPQLLKLAGENGATDAGYTVVRLNGAVADIFADWIYKAFPDRADKVLNQIAACHGGTLNDSRFGKRIKGEGVIPDTISRMFKIYKKKYIPASDFKLNTDLYKNRGGKQMTINF